MCVFQKTIDLIRTIFRSFRTITPLNSAAKKKIDVFQPIVFFTPNGGFPSMLSGPAIVARTLQDAGYRPLFIYCNGTMQTCTVMDGLYPLEPRPIRSSCESCSSRAQEFFDAYDLPSIRLEDLRTAAVCEQTDHLLADYDGLPQHFCYEGLPLGAYAAGNLSAIWKRDIHDDASTDVLERMRLMVWEALCNYLAFDAWIGTVSPTHFMYYAEYFNELAVAQAFRKHGVPISPIVHSSLHGHDFRRLTFPNQFPQIFDMQQRIKNWPYWQNLSLTKPQVQEIAQDSASRFLGLSVIVFSPKMAEIRKSLAADLNLDPNRRIIVAYTSSDDELNNIKRFEQLDTDSDEAQPFASQVEWLKAVTQFVENSDNLQLVVRFHPRLAPNARSNASAKYYQDVEALHELNASHLHIILPDQSVSSYLLAGHADLILTSWTSMGLECSRLGLPVIQAFRGANILPLGTFLRFKTTPEEFFAELIQALQTTPSVQNFKEAFRFTNMSFRAHEVDISDVVPLSQDGNLPPYKHPKNAEDIVRFTMSKENAAITSRVRQETIQSLELAAEEARALCEAIPFLIHVLAFNSEPQPATRIVISDQLLELSANMMQISLADNYQVKIQYEDRVAAWRSPAVANMCHIYQALNYEQTLS